MDETEVQVYLYERTETTHFSLHQLDECKQFVSLSLKSFLRLPFYQKLEYLAYTFLLRQKVIVPKQTTEYTKVTLSAYELQNILMTQIDNLRMNGHTPKVILIGRDIWKEISKDLYHVNRINSPISFEQSFHDTEFTYHGVKVIIVPWMVGSVVLPYSLEKDL